MTGIKSRLLFKSAAALFALILILVTDRARGQSSAVLITIDQTFNANERLVRFDSGTQTYAVSTGTSGAYYGVTVVNNVVLVADFIADKIQRFSPAGAYLGVFTSPSFSPVYLESDGSGNVYTTPDGIGIATATRYNFAGTSTGTFAAAGQFHGIDADTLGNVYIAHVNGTTREISKYAPNGSLLNTTLLGVSSIPSDIAIDEIGNRLFIADQGSSPNVIKIYDISGAAPSLTGSISAPVNAQISGLHYAAELGNILAVDSGDSSADPRGLEYSTSGTLIHEYRPSPVYHAQDITTFAVPEPSCAVLLLVSLLGIALNARSPRRC